MVNKPHSRRRLCAVWNLETPRTAGGASSAEIAGPVFLETCQPFYMNQNLHETPFMNEQRSEGKAPHIKYDDVRITIISGNNQLEISETEIFLGWSEWESCCPGHTGDMPY